MTRDRWSLAIHHEDRREGSLISERDFIRFADVHATMKRNKGKRFVIRISKTASTMEIQAIHNLRNLGYLVEAHFRTRTPSPPLVATLSSFISPAVQVPPLPNSTRASLEELLSMELALHDATIALKQAMSAAFAVATLGVPATAGFEVASAAQQAAE